jgi:hypothetical protein
LALLRRADRDREGRMIRLERTHFQWDERTRLTLSRLWQPSDGVFSLWCSPLHYFGSITFNP